MPSTSKSPASMAETVRSIRGRLRMTQAEFATTFDLPWATVRDWEQGRAKPDRAACAYLRIIGHMPDQVRDALAFERVEHEAMTSAIKAVSMPASKVVRVSASPIAAAPRIRIPVAAAVPPGPARPASGIRIRL